METNSAAYLLYIFNLSFPLQCWLILAQPKQIKLLLTVYSKDLFMFHGQNFYLDW